MKKRPLSAILILIAAASLGLGVGIAGAITINSAERVYAAPYVGGSRLYDCASIWATIQHGPPSGFASSAQSRGNSGGFCLNSTAQSLRVRTAVTKGQATCYGPVTTSWTYSTYQGYSTGSAYCGSGSYYGTAFGEFFDSLGRYYSSGPFPDVAGPIAG